MAENPIFPGTTMEVIEKYPPSRRLDHPDFGTVCKTSFAKGTITDFEKISDDPITVKSRVKVTGDFGESNYIPLFYHPKAQYWDGPLAAPPVLATDFDEELGAFKQAWMSFRVGDEVAVMLKEGIPVAVLGFADGGPRIGENIFRVSNDRDYLFNVFDTSYVFDSYDGPDKLDLGLSNKIDKTFERNYILPAVPVGIHYYEQYFKFIVGPFMVVIRLQKTYYPQYYIDVPARYNRDITIFKSTEIYTKKLFDSIKDYDSFYAAAYIDGTIESIGGRQIFPFYNIPTDSRSFVNFNRTEDVPWPCEVFTRPHTKAELQAAGMWPA